jgi:nucleoid-associated protein YgaU
MRKNTAGLVALVVLAIATLLMIFVVLPNVGDEEVAGTPVPPAETALATPEAGKPPGTAATSPAPNVAAPQGTAAADPSASGADAKGSRPLSTTSEQPATEKPVTQRPATDPAAADLAALPDAAANTPSFDIVRVEPDGSTVIAGKAEPNSKLEIVSGNAVVGTAVVGGTGDFAAIFDTPLPPGDYQLTLRATGPSGATTTSQEVATVSIPKATDGQLLAMVTKPGEASRIITAPSEPAASAPGSAAPAGAEPDAAGTGTAALDAAPATSAPTLPEGATRPAAVSVTAVEIEGSKLFIAGTARPGSTVRIYADDTLVGEGKVDAQGRFVIDGVTSLSIGQHVIRVDMIGADGRVQMRAAVPFERPAGDQISAVAQAPASGTDPAFDGAIFDASRAEAAKAFALLKGLFAGGKLPGLDQLAAARSATEIALTSLSGVKPVAGMQPALSARVTATTEAAGQALAILKPLPREAAAVGAALGRLDAAMARVLESGAPVLAAEAARRAPDMLPPPGQPAPSGTAAPDGTTSPPTQRPAGEPETLQQPPLQQSKTSVIIRRGDTLWQISRRVYGAGVRYTTIYVANEDQILDPDRILPGQVFGVPDTAMPDSESQEIHRRHMQHIP